MDGARDYHAVQWQLGEAGANARRKQWQIDQLNAEIAELESRTPSTPSQAATDSDKLRMATRLRDFAQQQLDHIGTPRTEDHLVEETA